MRIHEEHLEVSDTLAGYDRWAPSYDLAPNPLMAATSWVLDRAPLGCADCDVLELGCGTGRNVPRIIGEGARSYFGLDGSLGMLTIASQRHQDPRIQFAGIDLTQQWALDQQYDFALVCLVIEHLPILDPLLLSLSRALKPGGRLRIVDLHPERIASGSAATFREGDKNVCFSSVAHSLPTISTALDTLGFETVRRDWLAGDTMVAAVQGLERHRGLRLVVDILANRRMRDRRGSSQS